MKLVVQIPALNEGKTIRRVIEDVPKSIDGIDEIQFVVVNDGSSDNTIAEAKSAGAIVIDNVIRRGLGYTFAKGIEKSLRMNADVIVHIDGDGQFKSEDIPRLIKPVLSGQADMVTCTRFAKNEWVPNMSLAKKLGNRAVAGIVRIITGQKFSDVSCGFRAYSREAVLRLNLFGKFTYTQETFIDLVKRGMVIAEVPCQVKAKREFGKSKISGNLFSYGVRSLMIMLGAFRDYAPFKFFGTIGIVIILLGVIAGSLVFAHWLNTGTTFPYRSGVTASALLLIVGFLVLMLAFIADMLGRNRKTLEDILYLERKRTYRN